MGRRKCHSNDACKCQDRIRTVKPTDDDSTVKIFESMIKSMSLISIFYRSLVTVFTCGKIGESVSFRSKIILKDLKDLHRYSKNDDKTIIVS